jgi:hypothetical protein
MTQTIRGAARRHRDHRVIRQSRTHREPFANACVTTGAAGSDAGGNPSNHAGIRRNFEVTLE